MKVSAIQNNNQLFGAKIAEMPRLNSVVQYMSEHRMRPGKTDYTEHFYLWKKIEYAILNHPSDVELFTDVRYFQGKKPKVVGIIKSDKAEITNSDSDRIYNITKVLNIWHDFLNPDNKKVFNRIMGKEYKDKYQPWWDTFIAPYWKDIQKFYKDEI